jgi:hypothetical protein
VQEGTVVQLDASASSDPDAGTHLTFAWTVRLRDPTSCPDVSLNPNGNVAKPTFPAHDDCVYTLQVAVSDGNAMTVATDSVQVTVQNRNPTIGQVVNGGPIVAGGGTGIAVTASDPAGTFDPLMYEFDCDDNNAYESGPQATPTASCSFASAGDARVNVRVTDGDGGSATAVTTVVVTPANTAPTPPGKPTLSGGSGTPNKGVFSLAWTASTDAENQPITYTLERKASNGPNFSQAIAGLMTNSYTFAAGSPEAEGVWSYRVSASDGSLSSTVSTVSNPVTVDRTAPTITLQSRTPSPNANGWNNVAVTITWKCEDNGSGPTAPTVSQTVASEGTNQSAAGTCVDQAGNTASDTRSAISIDTSSPTMTYASHPASYTVDQVVAITCTAADQPHLSGLASTTCQSVNRPAYTFNVGSNTLSATATDKAGNTGSGSTAFTVVVDGASLNSLIDQFLPIPPNTDGDRQQLKSHIGNKNFERKVLENAAAKDAPTKQAPLTYEQGQALIRLHRALYGP